MSEGHWVGTSIWLAGGIVHPEAALTLGDVHAITAFTCISCTLLIGRIVAHTRSLRGGEPRLWISISVHGCALCGCAGW